ncbi:MAG TPA: hypothetical protein VJ997_11565 [Longimicrobiales bacterium]|nr:hypothetical protein [Longimicrobiales bacterium]
MNRPDTHRTLGRTAILAAVVIGLAGCMDYTIETTVNADGTGVRLERMELTRNGDAKLTERQVRELTLATPDRGWRSSTRVDQGGDTTWVLERKAEVRRLSGWSDPDRRTLILGTTPDKAERRVGYVRLGDVVFRSSIQVAVARRSDGTSLVTYRESFLWDQAADALVESLVQDLDRTLAQRYPRLTAPERAAILGFARARIWVAGDEGMFTGENESEAIDRAADKTAEQAVKVVRVRYPEAEADTVRRIVKSLLDDENDSVSRLFEAVLPGMNLGLNTSVVFRLTLPGTVTTNNASERDGNTLEWKFSPLDNFTGPVEVFAESVVEGSR